MPGSMPSDIRVSEPAPDDELGVQAFLDALGEALTSGQTQAIADTWDLPAYLLGADVAEAIEERGELLTIFSGARENYNARGVTNTRADIVRLDELNPRLVSVRVRWPWLDSEDREVGAETSTYTLRKDDAGDWKLRVAVMHGAEAVN